MEGILITLVVLYFIPTVIALFRRHTHLMAIAVVNIFLGFTGIGWIGALVWAVLPNKKTINI